MHFLKVGNINLHKHFTEETNKSFGFINVMFITQ